MHRLAVLTASWDHQVEGLADIYLQWKHRVQEVELRDVEEGSYWEVILVSFSAMLCSYLLSYLLIHHPPLKLLPPSTYSLATFE